MIQIRISHYFVCQISNTSASSTWSLSFGLVFHSFGFRLFFVIIFLFLLLFLFLLSKSFCFSSFFGSLTSGSLSTPFSHTRRLRYASYTSSFGCLFRLWFISFILNGPTYLFCSCFSLFFFDSLLSFCLSDLLFGFTSCSSFSRLLIWFNFIFLGFFCSYFFGSTWFWFFAFCFFFSWLLFLFIIFNGLFKSITMQFSDCSWFVS